MTNKRKAFSDKADAMQYAEALSYTSACEVFVWLDEGNWRVTKVDPRAFQYSYVVPAAIFFDGELV